MHRKVLHNKSVLHIICSYNHESNDWSPYNHRAEDLLFNSLATTKSYIIILQQNHTSLYSHVLQQNHNTSSPSHTLQQNHPPQYMVNDMSYSYGHRSDTLSLRSLAILGSDDPWSTNLLISCSTFIT